VNELPDPSASDLHYQYPNTGSKTKSCVIIISAYEVGNETITEETVKEKVSVSVTRRNMPTTFDILFVSQL
jgi:hypothetical protein